VGLIRRILGTSSKHYRLNALVSCRRAERELESALHHHIVCDLDKTYVETEFESWVKMARIPFEKAHEKVTVAGAGEVLQELRWGSPKVDHISSPRMGLHFVSSSPPQLRAVLEGKLILDGLDWSTDTFKNQTYNLRMARIDLLRHHIAYKAKAILDLAAVFPEGATFWLIGDNAEYDPFVYAALKAFLCEQIDVTGLSEWLSAAGVERNVVDQVLLGTEGLQGKSLVCGGIFIRKLQGYPVIEAPPLTSSIVLFESWLQIAWILFLDGLLSSSSMWRLIRGFHNQYGISLSHVSWAINDFLSTHRDLSAPVASGIDDVVKKLSSCEIIERKCYGWTFKNRIIPAENNSQVLNYGALAKGWYRDIERSKRPK